MRETYYQLNQKDTIFRRLFMEKKNALDLYNAINKTAHTDVDKLEITTLEDSIYMKFKNDICCFYNGTTPQPEEQILRLSDAYEKRTCEPELELTVKVYNVNLGHNSEFLESCSLLKEYAQYVEQIREYTAKGLPFAEAVEQTIDNSIH